MDVQLGARAGVHDHGFAEELSFEGASDDEVSIDLTRVRDVHPMFAARIHLLVAWHRERGRRVDIQPPAHRPTRAALKLLRVGEQLPAGAEGVPEVPGVEVVLPLVRIEQITQVDAVAEALFPLLLDHFDDVAVVRDAVAMAVSELCQNAVEHGSNPLGAIVAATRAIEPGRARLTLIVADRGIGMPEHLRRRRPDLVVDEHAIACAVQEGVTGTTRPDRGYGFTWVLNETLASAATGAELFVRSGHGRFRRTIAGGAPVDTGGPAAHMLGTWIVHEWLTVARR